MKFGKTLLAAAACCAVLGAGSEAQAQYRAQRIITGLTLPLYVTAPAGDYSRIFILEQRSGTTGRIRIATMPVDFDSNYTLSGTPYLSISPVTTGSEQGLLGLAFHPDFMNNGYFFVNYTNSSGSTIVARYQANAPFATSTTANPTGTTLLTIAQPFSNHNGGWIGFGPDGMLYIATGDGGSGNDPGNRAQNVNELLGKMLRIDVDGADNIPGNDDDDGAIGMTLPPYTNPADNPFFGAIAGRDEIWHYGLRNHWRNAFDTQTGDLYIGDVGQNAVEEISFQTAHTPGTLPGQPGYQGGQNYGWRCMEGNTCTGLTGCVCEIGCAGGPLTCPIHTNTHVGGICSITGGEVYRGCGIPTLNGFYFFADYCANQIWSFRYTGSGTVPGAGGALVTRTADLAPGGGVTVNSITSFGRDAFGELYIVDQGGEVFKVITDAAPGFEGPDCNGNGRPDCNDIRAGSSADVNMNGIPDECDPRACCFADGTCQDLSPAACTDIAGTPQAFGVLCASNPCPQPTQACCLADGTCQDLSTTDCATAGGVAQGDGSVCATAMCPLPCPGDFSGNGCVGLEDIAIVIQQWGVLGLEDIALVSKNWLLECVPGACSR